MQIYNKQRHIELVKHLLDLRNKKKFLFHENRKEFLELLEYNMVVEEHVYLTHYDEFVKIIKNFLVNKINFDEFETAFSLLYYKVRKESKSFSIDLEQIENFQPTTRPYRFASTINAFYRQFEEIEDEYTTQQEVTKYIKETCLKEQIFKDELDIWI